MRMSGAEVVLLVRMSGAAVVLLVRMSGAEDAETAAPQQILRQQQQREC